MIPPNELIYYQVCKLTWECFEDEIKKRIGESKTIREFENIINEMK